jgi:hypothetical protein
MVGGREGKLKAVNQQRVRHVHSKVKFSSSTRAWFNCGSDTVVVASRALCLIRITPSTRRTPASEPVEWLVLIPRERLRAIYRCPRRGFESCLSGFLLIERRRYSCALRWSYSPEHESRIAHRTAFVIQCELDTGDLEIAGIALRILDESWTPAGGTGTSILVRISSGDSRCMIRSPLIGSSSFHLPSGTDERRSPP